MLNVTTVAGFEKCILDNPKVRCRSNSAHATHAYFHFLIAASTASVHYFILFYFCVASYQVVVHFWAGWCDPCSLLDQVLEQLENDSPSVTGVRVEAEEAPEISERCTVTVVPLIVFFSGGKEVDRLEGADAAALSSKFLTLAAAAGTTPMASRVGVAGTAPTEVATTVPLQERIEALVRQQPVMLFMKGE